MQQGSEALDFGQAFGIVRRRAPLIMFCTLVVAVAAFGFSKQQPEEYTATASLVFSSNPLSQQIAGLSIGSTADQFTQQASNVELVRLGDMAAKTAKALGHGLTERKVSENLTVVGQGESSIVSVSATSRSPALAAKISNSYVHQFVREQQGSNRAYFKDALKLVNKQLDELPANQRFGAAAVSLQNRAQTLRLLEGLKYESVQMAQAASIPISPSSPKTLKNTILGGMLGLLLGLGLAFVLERLRRERRIGDVDDLKSIYDLPLLGIVPESPRIGHSTGRKRSKSKELRPAEAEAFNLIRAQLRFFDVDSKMKTILVTSAGPGEGKTTISRRLAEAAAMLGSRVLLLEGDLRHPTLGAELNLPSGPGLPDVLVGATSFEEAIQSVRLGSGLGERVVDVLSSGDVQPPNTGELIESSAMKATLERARSSYDLILVDTPPLTLVSDAFPLLDIVDGVVVVSWLGGSPRDLAEQLRQILNSGGAPTLGIIANGAKPRSLGTYAAARPKNQRSLQTTPPPTISANGQSPEAPIPSAKA